MKKPIMTGALVVAIIAFGLSVFNVVNALDFTYFSAKAHVMTIEDCEYIAYTDLKGYGSIIHKENCKYCAQRKVKEKQ